MSKDFVKRKPMKVEIEVKIVSSGTFKKEVCRICDNWLTIGNHEYDLREGISMCAVSGEKNDARSQYMIECDGQTFMIRTGSPKKKSIFEKLTQQFHEPTIVHPNTSNSKSHADVELDDQLERTEEIGNSMTTYVGEPEDKSPGKGTEQRNTRNMGQCSKTKKGKIDIGTTTGKFKKTEWFITTENVLTFDNRELRLQGGISITLVADGKKKKFLVECDGINFYIRTKSAEKISEWKRLTKKFPMSSEIITENDGQPTNSEKNAYLDAISTTVPDNCPKDETENLTSPTRNKKAKQQEMQILKEEPKVTKQTPPEILRNISCPQDVKVRRLQFTTQCCDQGHPSAVHAVSRRYLKRIFEDWEKDTTTSTKVRRLFKYLTMLLRGKREEQCKSMVFETATIHINDHDCGNACLKSCHTTVDVPEDYLFEVTQTEETNCDNTYLKCSPTTEYVTEDQLFEVKERNKTDCGNTCLQSCPTTAVVPQDNQFKITETNNCGKTCLRSCCATKYVTTIISLKNDSSMEINPKNAVGELPRPLQKSKFEEETTNAFHFHDENHPYHDLSFIEGNHDQNQHNEKSVSESTPTITQDVRLSKSIHNVDLKPSIPDIEIVSGKANCTTPSSAVACSGTGHASKFPFSLRKQAKPLSECETISTGKCEIIPTEKLSPKSGEETKLQSRLKKKQTKKIACKRKSIVAHSVPQHHRKGILNVIMKLAIAFCFLPLVPASDPTEDYRFQLLYEDIRQQLLRHETNGTQRLLLDTLSRIAENDAHRLLRFSNFLFYINQTEINIGDNIGHWTNYLEDMLAFREQDGYNHSAFAMREVIAMQASNLSTSNTPGHQLTPTVLDVQSQQYRNSSVSDDQDCPDGYCAFGTQTSGPHDEDPLVVEGAEVTLNQNSSTEDQHRIDTYRFSESGGILSQPM